MSHAGEFRAVVLGAGFAGSLAAHVLLRRGFRVTVVDRDPAAAWDTSPDGRRPGQPHADQLHNVLARAQRHVVELVPDFADRFTAAGGQRARVSSGTEVFELGRRMPRRELGLEIWSARKSVIDDVVAASTEGCRRETARAVGLRTVGGHVTGVDTDRGGLDADLVVDATGAHTMVPYWLEDPPEMVRRATHQWYATMPVETARATSGQFWMTFPTFPRTRGGLASPLGPTTWNVSVSGGRADPPPADEYAFRRFVEGLEDPSLHALVSGATALGSPRTFRKPSASWRRYDRSATLPAGLFCVGDAVADLDPLFGQGMSVAAWQVAELSATLAATTGDADPRAGWSREHAQRSAVAVETAWRLAEIFAPASRDALTGDEWDQLALAVEHDAEVHRRYVEVWHLLRPAGELRTLARTTVPSSA